MSIFKHFKYEYFSFRRNLIRNELENFLDCLSDNNRKPTANDEEYFNKRLCKMLKFSNKALELSK